MDIRELCVEGKFFHRLCHRFVFFTVLSAFNLSVLAQNGGMRKLILQGVAMVLTCTMRIGYNQCNLMLSSIQPQVDRRCATNLRRRSLQSAIMLSSRKENVGMKNDGT